jgi:hypothetical protein
MARDKIHESVCKALEKEGWKITDDPLVLLPEEDNIAIDLGPEKLISAEKGLEKIAVEVKTFNQPSIMYEFHRAIGQYFNYETALLESGEMRELWVAVPDSIFSKLFKSRIIKRSIERMQMKFLVVNLNEETIKEWKK